MTEYLEQSTRVSERAVVLGCGMAGIAAAATLSNHFDEVVIIERDELPEEPQARRGVPQDEQLHNLLSVAQINLETLLPGFLDNLQKAGGGNAGVSDQTHVHELGMPMPERNIGLRLMSAWRPVMEHVARERLMQRQNIVRGLGRATGLCTHEQGIAGAVVEAERGRKIISGSVVVDATGGKSQAYRWLAEQGLDVPPVDEKRVDQWYVSTQFKRPEAYQDCPDFWLSLPHVGSSRGALVSPITDGRWYVSASGHGRDTPPRTAEEVKEYARTLDDDLAVSQLIDNAQPLSKPNLFRKTSAYIRRYDLLEQPLVGFLPVGDSLASLNPLFGQGISVASQQSIELGSLLTSYVGGEVGRTALTATYLDQAVHRAQTAWNLGEVVDNTISGSSEDMQAITRRQKALGQLISDNPELHKKYVGIWHLIEPAAILQSPDFVKGIEDYSSYSNGNE